jgi:hypothetical protein
VLLELNFDSNGLPDGSQKDKKGSRERRNTDIFLNKTIAIAIA